MSQLLSQFWHKFKWLPALVLGLVALIDPRHVDEFAAAHPRWESVILALWGVLLSYRGREVPAVLSGLISARPVGSSMSTKGNEK